MAYSIMGSISSLIIRVKQGIWTMVGEGGDFLGQAWISVGDLKLRGRKSGAWSIQWLFVDANGAGRVSHGDACGLFNHETLAAA